MALTKVEMISKLSEEMELNKKVGIRAVRIFFCPLPDAGSITQD